ncbi:hypothetical protein Ciccas_007861 [Cichlidogyrus casuarinus]|uniref:SAM-dependent MTase TRM10-type domain-containing protein n=1 Tax=Cichlidogyrus casuarinus TaxID=1844966 RepID=A0ABD2Q1Q4_9PLAT
MLGDPKNRGLNHDLKLQFARLNRFKANDQRITELLSDFKQIKYSTNTSYTQFLELTRNLEENAWCLDYHFPKELFIFSKKVSLWDKPFIKDRTLIIQDKASALPPFALLRDQDFSDVIDCCSAPGNKTSLLASIMNDKSSEDKKSRTLYAFDNDQKRFDLLCKNMSNFSIPNISVNQKSVTGCQSQNSLDLRCLDFLSTDPQQFQSVTHILLDPSCSGSGLPVIKRGTTKSSTAEDLRSLSSLQTKMLVHALSFPNVQRVVYSTCSIHEEENEFVVRTVRDKFSEQFQLVPLWQDTWQNRGLTDCDSCVRASPDHDGTIGFFIAVFQRRVPQKRPLEGKQRPNKRNRLRNELDVIFQEAKKARLPKAEKKKLKFEKIKQQRIEKRKAYRERTKERKRIKQENDEQVLSRKSILKASVKMIDSECKTVFVIDCSFNDLMSTKDICKLSNQLCACYGINRRLARPVQFVITGLGRDSHQLDEEFKGGPLDNAENVLMQRLIQCDAENWDVTLKQEHFLELFPKDRIVYLSAEAEQELPDEIPSSSDQTTADVFVIGGLIDHNHHKGHCHRLALESGLKTARFPFDRIKFDIAGRKVLSIVHVFESLARVVTNTEKWDLVLNQVIPKRKIA